MAALGNLPNNQTTIRPTQPTAYQFTCQPISQRSSQPLSHPISQPLSQPISQPISQPTNIPTNPTRNCIQSGNDRQPNPTTNQLVRNYPEVGKLPSCRLCRTWGIARTTQSIQGHERLVVIGLLVGMVFVALLGLACLAGWFGWKVGYLVWLLSSVAWIDCLVVADAL